jgi:hypothetical protein
MVGRKGVKREEGEGRRKKSRRYTCQSGFIVVGCSETNNGIPSNSRFIFQDNVVKISPCMGKCLCTSLFLL